MNKHELLDYILNELPDVFTFDYDACDEGRAYLTNTETVKEFTITIDD